MSEKQSVAEPEAREQEVPEPEGGAQDKSLEELLSEFDEPARSESAPAEPESPKPSLSKDDLAEVVAFTRQAQAERTKADIDAAVEQIHSNLDDGVAISKNAVRRMLNGAAGEDERIQKAWMQRHTNPSLYQKTLRALAREWSNEFQPIDKAATAEREAVSNAVRSASKQAAPEPEDYSKVAFMNDADFEQWKKEQARKMKA